MAKGREVPPRRELCRHTWVIVLEQGVTLILECEFCEAVVVCEVGHHDRGHSFAFSSLRGIVSPADLQLLGEWFGRQVGEHQAVHAEVRSARRRRRRSPARAA